MDTTIVNKNTTQYVLYTTIYKQTQKHNTICVVHHYIQTNTKTQHNMCCTPLYTNKHKNTTQYVLYTTIVNKNTTQYVLYTTIYKQTQKHNTICVGHHYSKQKHNTICVVHHYIQTNTKTQHNMCCTPLYTNKHKNTTQYVMDTTIYKQTQKHNTICVVHHYIQTNTKTQHNM